MRLIIHRGSNQIGGSCVELESAGSRVIIDLGSPLTAPGVAETTDDDIPSLLNSGVLPRISGLYADDVPSVAAVIISHSHRDHVGLIQHVHPDIPIYTSTSTADLLRTISTFVPSRSSAKPRTVFSDLPVRTRIPLGPFFVTANPVDHSAPDATSILIEAENKRVLYSGDFRSHGRKSALFKYVITNPPTNIDILILEGTMFGRGPQEYPDETAVEAEIVQTLINKQNAAFMFCSSQNLDRVVSAYRSALRTDTTLVIDLYTAFVLKTLSKMSSRIPQCDWRGIRVLFWKIHADRLVAAGEKEFLYAAAKSKIEIEEIAEKRKSILALVRNNSLFEIMADRIPEAQHIRLIWSMWAGYLISGTPIRRFADKHDLPIKQIHTSGHAVVDDLKRFCEALQPKFVVPIHTQHPDQYDQIYKSILKINDGVEHVV